MEGENIIVVPMVGGEDEKPSRDEMLKYMCKRLEIMERQMREQMTRLMSVESRIGRMYEMVDDMYNSPPHGPGYQFALRQFQRHLNGAE